MSKISLLNAIIADMRQKLSQVITRSDDKTEVGKTINSIRIPGEGYKFGCSSISKNKKIQGLDHGGPYPTSSKDS